jgi:uncharacterized protein
MKKLDNLLQKYKALTYNTPVLHGLYTSLVCTPVSMIPLKAHMEMIFGSNNTVEWDSIDEAQYFLEHSKDLWNSIIDILRNKWKYVPLTYSDELDNPIIEDWITGFAIGMHAIPSFWQILLDNPTHHELLNPIITLYNRDNLPSALLRSSESESLTRAECIKLIQINIPAVYDFYDTYRRIWNERLMSGYKTGRNEPCPCGSGKKYKKCCMDITFN